MMNGLYSSADETWGSGQAEYCFRVARRISLTTCSDDTLVASDFSLISASPSSYDEPEILPSSTRSFCLTSADGGQVGKEKPMGERGAWVADTKGEAQD